MRSPKSFLELVKKNNELEFSWYVNSTDGQYTGFSDTLSFIATREIIGVPTEAIISSIMDVPNDQGGWVYVNFLKSPYDTDLQDNRSEQYSIERLDENTWVNVVSGNAYGQDEYTYHEAKQHLLFIAPSISASLLAIVKLIITIILSSLIR